VRSSYPTARLTMADGSCHSVIALWSYLKARCGERGEGWIFKAFSASGHLTIVDKKFRQARLDAGIPEKLVLYCGRHDYGTRLLQGTGKLEQVRRVLNGTKGNFNPGLG